MFCCDMSPKRSVLVRSSLAKLRQTTSSLHTCISYDCRRNLVCVEQIQSLDDLLSFAVQVINQN